VPYGDFLDQIIQLDSSPKSRTMTMLLKKKTVGKKLKIKLKKKLFSFFF